MARTCGVLPMHARILEPSAGDGALVAALYEVAPMPEITAVEIDPVMHTKLRARFHQECPDVELNDYLERMRPTERYFLGLSNPPYEDGLDGLFLEKLMRECDRIVALIRIAALCGADRRERVWSRVDSHADGWWMPGLYPLSSRPSFLAAGEESESAKSDFVVVKLSRVGTPKATEVEWW